MKSKKVTTVISLMALMLAGTACKTFVVEDVNYAHQIESVLTPDENGLVNDMRHGISFNILPFQYQEYADTSFVAVEEVRMIRNAKGYYFITANDFNHVYVMEPKQGELKLKKKIQVAENGLASPAFNLRNSLVQLVELDSKQTMNLNENGVQENNQEEQS